MRRTLASSILSALALTACNGSDPIEASASGTSDGTTTDESGTGTTATTTTVTTTGTGTDTTGTASDTATTTTTTTTTSSSESESATDPSTTSTTEPITSTDPTTTGTTDPTTTGTTDMTTTGTTDMTTGTTDMTTGTTGMMEDPCPCADVEVPLDDGIFVLSDTNQLWKYKPDGNTFEMLGGIGCNGVLSNFSMAVDRLGFAWVMYSSPVGAIRKVDVTNPANCTDPGYVPGQMGVQRYGMAFVTQDQFNTCDQLYGNTWNGQGGFSEGPNFGQFLTVDPMSLQVQLLGNTTFNGAELTGTGDGRVFLFGGANPAKLVEVNKQNGEYLDVLPLGNLSLTNAFAFAFFAGDFYFFTEGQGGSKVTHLDYDGDLSLTTINPGGPIRVVGAGVSTCAPFLPQ